LRFRNPVLFIKGPLNFHSIQVLSLVPKEQDGENFDNALARVRRCVGGGTEADNADSDSDIEVVADSVSVNLRCPVSTVTISENALGP
jgi:E3 SUMO-protein ligase PIAS1